MLSVREYDLWDWVTVNSKNLTNQQQVGQVNKSLSKLNLSYQFFCSTVYHATKHKKGTAFMIY